MIMILSLMMVRRRKNRQKKKKKKMCKLLYLQPAPKDPPPVRHIQCGKKQNVSRQWSKSNLRAR